MTIAKIRSLVVPAYVFLCLLLGGSAQGIWQMALLQIIAILVIAWSFASPPNLPIPKLARQLNWLIVAALGLFAVQMVPLPPAIWTALPGRDLVVEGRSILGLPLGWSSLSLAPYDTAAAILSLLPPVAILAAVFRRNACSPTWLAAAICAATLAGITLGALQTASPDPLNSPWYPYLISNFGVATGFFANSNHMASLLLVAVPFTVATASFASRQATEVRTRRALLVMGAAALAVIMIGVALNGSLTGYGLIIPVTLVSLLMAFSLGSTTKRTLVGLCIAGLLAFVALLFSPVGERLPGNQMATSVTTRQTMLVTGVEALKSFAPAGSGLGTFPKIYRLFENPDQVERTYVNHAHNDYLELAIETGLPGLVLVGLFLAWWGAAVRRMLASPAADEFALAGAIGSASILIHSLVDYPLRTTAMSTVFAACLAMILISRKTASSEKDLRPTRHLTIG